MPITPIGAEEDHMMLTMLVLTQEQGVAVLVLSLVMLLVARLLLGEKT